MEGGGKGGVPAVAQYVMVTLRSSRRSRRLNVMCASRVQRSSFVVKR